MKNFVELIKSKEEKITESYIGKELKNFENISKELELKHHQILEDLYEINHILTLVNKHKIDVKKNKESSKKLEKGWLTDIKHTFEKLHLKKTTLLTTEDLVLLEKETSKLLFEKERLEKEHKELHGVLAKYMVLLMDVRNTVAKEITDGHNVAQIAETLLEKLSKKIEEVIFYEKGKSKIMKFLEEEYSINKTHARTLFDVLLKSNAIIYTTDKDNFNASYYNGAFDFSTNYVYVPVSGKWTINS